jgi:hypothetical protein
MSNEFSRFSDPNDLIGFHRHGVDKTELMHCARMALHARSGARPLGLWTTPWCRADYVLREMFGHRAISNASGLEITTAAFRLYLLDFLTGCKAIAIVTEEEFYDVAVPISGIADDSWIPPVDSKLGALYVALREARVFERPRTPGDVLDEWLKSIWSEGRKLREQMKKDQEARG